jgi:hypothetical protein
LALMPFQLLQIAGLSFMLWNFALGSRITIKHSNKIKHTS